MEGTSWIINEISYKNAYGGAERHGALRRGAPHRKLQKYLTRNGQNTETDSIFDNLCESKNNLSSQKFDCHMSTTSLLKEEEEEEDLNVDGDTIVPYGYGTYLWTPEHRRLIAFIFVYI